MDEVTRRRLTRNEELFRRINEEIEENRSGTGPVGYVCECADPACAETIPLTAAEYAAIREGDRRFVVAPGHVVPGLEQVVERADDHVVVEKSD
jgi:hypothetical protein